jgi:hypothetical protein
MGVGCSRRSVQEEAESQAKARRAAVLNRFRAAVHVVVRHLKQRRDWNAYGLRLQREPGLKAVFDRVQRRKGHLTHKSKAGS